VPTVLAEVTPVEGCQLSSLGWGDEIAERLTAYSTEETRTEQRYVDLIESKAGFPPVKQEEWYWQEESHDQRIWDDCLSKTRVFSGQLFYSLTK
jgi:hypothetical protein